MALLTVPSIQGPDLGFLGQHLGFFCNNQAQQIGEYLMTSAEVSGNSTRGRAERNAIIERPPAQADGKRRTFCGSDAAWGFGINAVMSIVRGGRFRWWGLNP